MLDFNAYLCRKLSKQSSIYPGLLSLSTAENKNLKLISIILSNNFYVYITMICRSYLSEFLLRPDNYQLFNE